jgi:hypothetical protein
MNEQELNNLLTKTFGDKAFIPFTEQEKTRPTTWIGLTPEEIDDIIADAIDPMDAVIQTMDKLKEKNSSI